jgi:hypothetical protein
MVMIGWNHPKERTFAKMVDLSELYPITILEDLTEPELELFMKKEVALCREIAGMEASKLAKKVGLPKKRILELQKQCKVVINE